MLPGTLLISIKGDPPLIEVVPRIFIEVPVEPG
jgi:hypothetical protein